LNVTCLANIAHLDDRKISDIPVKKIVCDAFDLMKSGGSKGFLLEARNVMEFTQIYKLEDETSLNVFTNSLEKNTLSIPANDKVQFHVYPKMSSQQLKSILENSDDERIKHSYSSFIVSNTISLSSSSHLIKFPLALVCHLPELKVSSNCLDFGSVYYGNTEFKDFSITNSSQHCKAFYKVQIPQTRESDSNFYLVENKADDKNTVIKKHVKTGILLPGENIRVMTGFKPDGKQLSYSLKATIFEELVGKTEVDIEFKGMASFDSKGDE